MQSQAEKRAKIYMRYRHLGVAAVFQFRRSRCTSRSSRQKILEVGLIIITLGNFGNFGNFESRILHAIYLCIKFLTSRAAWKLAPVPIEFTPSCGYLLTSKLNALMVPKPAAPSNGETEEDGD